ncbi:MAG: RNA 2',3'-cyclic phosphodiesterase [Thermoplasmata archaeon]|nr:RNA 2',3'-cyclic phosphodiesterase [Thermoplasmata archaeon]
MRAFIAIEVPPLPHDPGEETRKGGNSAHLTLRFFEDLDERRLPQVVAALDRAARSTSSFRLALEGLGAFPNARSPRVLWVGLGLGREHAIALAGRVSAELEAIGFAPEPRGFTPHVTLFRVRNARDRDRALRLLSSGVGVRYGETTIRELVLKESLLSRTGAVHQVLHRGALPDAPGSP